MKRPAHPIIKREEANNIIDWNSDKPKGEYVGTLLQKQTVQFLKGSRIVRAERKHKGWYGFRSVIREVGEEGVVVGEKVNKERTKVLVRWQGFTNKKGKVKTERSKKDEWTACRISEVIALKHRRMAQREYSNCHDSPVMVRLLQEIVAAQDK